MEKTDVSLKTIAAGFKPATIKNNKYTHFPCMPKQGEYMFRLETLDPNGKEFAKAKELLMPLLPRPKRLTFEMDIAKKVKGCNSGSVNLLKSGEFANLAGSDFELGDLSGNDSFVDAYSKLVGWIAKERKADIKIFDDGKVGMTIRFVYDANGCATDISSIELWYLQKIASAKQYIVAKTRHVKVFIDAMCDKNDDVLHEAVCYQGARASSLGQMDNILIGIAVAAYFESVRTIADIANDFNAQLGKSLSEQMKDLRSNYSMIRNNAEDLRKDLCGLQPIMIEPEPASPKAKKKSK